jgi:hypothetical protein
MNNWMVKLITDTIFKIEINLNNKVNHQMQMNAIELK